jgi:ferrous iron transport protein A
MVVQLDESTSPGDVLCLDEVEPGSKVKVVHVRGRGTIRKRLLAVGFVPGTVIEVVRRAPLEDPVEYKVKGYNLSLRSREAHLVEVEHIED